MKSKYLLLTSLLFVLLAGVFSACEKDDKKQWGETTTFFKIQDEDMIFAPAMVQFVNASKNAEAYHWVFPKGKIVVNEAVTADTVTTAIQPDRVFYPLPGIYQATLTITADGKETQYTREFVVKKPQPRILFEPAGVVFEDTVYFRAEFFQYEDKQDLVTYSWDFGNNETSTEAQPFTTYSAPGDYLVTLTLFDGVETLVSTRLINVQAEIAKTLYITDAITKNMFMKKLYTQGDLPAERMNMDVGLHPLSVTVYQERIVVSVAGNNIRFAATGTPADGYIFTTNLQGGNRWIITQPTTMEHTYIDDPFVSTVGPDGMVYWVDRFQGARRIHISEQNAEYPKPYVFHQASEGSDLAAAIGVTSAFGWTDGAVRIVNNELWYSKHGTGRGLYRFSIAGEYLGKIEPLFDYKIKSFEVDVVNGKIYFAVNNAAGGLNPGLYRCNLDGTNIQLIDALEDFSMQGGEAERTYVTSIVIDRDGGYIYYPFRHQDDLNTLGEIVGDGSKSGVKRWKIDASETPEFYVSGIIPYGIGIDHVKR